MESHRAVADDAVDRSLRGGDPGAERLRDPRAKLARLGRATQGVDDAGASVDYRAFRFAQPPGRGFDLGRQGGQGIERPVLPPPASS